MMKLIGYIVQLLSIVGGYLMAGGHLGALWQPNELIIIGGSGVGAFMISNSSFVQQTTLKNIKKIFSKSPYDKHFFMQLLKLLYQIFDTIKKKGMAGVEDDMEAPENSEIFKRFPEILADERLILFITDTFRMIGMVTLNAHELEEVMENEIHAVEAQEIKPGESVQEMADAFPGFGIVAAVMGIVVTMQAMGGPVEVIGHHVAAALVGTFLGILLCYGIVGPLATSLKFMAQEKKLALDCVRMAMVGFQGGRPPLLAVDAARRVLNDSLRPNFLELEEWLRGEI